MQQTNKKILIEIFRQEILPNLKFVEKERQAIIQKLIFQENLAFTGLIITFLSGCYFFANGNNILLVLLITIFLAILALIIYIPYSLDKSFKKNLKQQYLPILLRKIHSLKWGINRYCIDSTSLQDCGLFSKFKNIINDDTFNGKYKDINFNIIESKLYDLKKDWLSKAPREYKLKVFQGIIIGFSFYKKHNTTTVVTTKKDFNSRNNICINITAIVMGLQVLFFHTLILLFYNSINEPCLIFFYIAPIFFICYSVHYIYKKIKNEKIWNNKKIKLEDPIWEKKFNVYSEDEIEARYLVTTAFMERFLKLNTSFGVNKAKCAFYKDQIILAISTNKNIFEIGNLFTSVTDLNYWYKFINELSSILDMIEYFKLDEMSML